MNNILHRERAFHRGGISRLARDTPISVHHGRGSTLFADNGREYLDLFANAGIASLGHGNAAFADYLGKQAGQLICSPFANGTRARLWEKLRSHLPTGINRAFFFSTGAEANEAALRFVRAYTGRSGVVAFRSGYHGRTKGTSQLTEEHVKDGDRFLLDYPASHGGSSGEERLEATRHAVTGCLESASGRIGALFVEPIQGTAGNIVPPDGFLAMLREVCSAHGVLLVVDEVLTGIGRTGAWFRFLKEKITPDLVVLGKGIGNGVPISMILTRDAIADCPIQISSSFGGNLLSAAAADFVLGEIVNNNLNQRVAENGQGFIQKLTAALGQIPVFGSVEGDGLMIGLRLRDPWNTDAPLSDGDMDVLQGHLLEQCLIVGRAGSRLRINPPLVISADEIDLAVSRLAFALAATSDALAAR
jgi:4-aminobutyrate aminotransferase-like enzyme